METQKRIVLKTGEVIYADSLVSWCNGIIRYERNGTVELIVPIESLSYSESVPKDNLTNEK